MKIKYFSPHWGFGHLGFAAYCKQVAAAGFDGIEMNLSANPSEAEASLNLLEENGLELLAQHSETQSADFGEHLEHCRSSLMRITAFKPAVINCHTGRDWFTFAQNLQIIDAAFAVTEATGVPILHETHRGRFGYSAATTAAFLQARPGLRLTADFSHWCTVSESFLHGQEAFVEEAIKRADHIHSRVGHDQGPQVGDPRAPEWQAAVEIHMGWWDRIVACHQAKGSAALTITTEFGPPPYLPVLPYTQEPVASQWEINLYMLQLLKTRYAQETRP